MAFRSGSGLNPPPTQLQLLLEEIKFQQQKELHSAIIEGESGAAANFMSRGTTFWTGLFTNILTLQYRSVLH